jgi:cyclopropane fatty-acyl-phospholipid synthase-like methyltransferase
MDIAMAFENKPFSQACEENRSPIQAVLERYLTDLDGTLLEIGSGTGQHAAYFGPRFPSLTWQTSDLAEYLPGIRRWVEETGSANLPAPLELDVTGTWPDEQFDVVFSANTAHIMSQSEVDAMFQRLPGVLGDGGLLLLYGPFNYGGRYTSSSNARFDQWLKERDPQSGIKAFETLDRLARASGMALVQDHEMPVNNRILVWRRVDDLS